MRLYFFGFSGWKRKQTKNFFLPLDGKRFFFCKDLQHALAKGMDENAQLYIWGKKPFPEVETYAEENKLRLFRVEDGFIRSVTLGSDLTKAYSLVVDSRGIYFDPTQESDLEHMLNTYVFDGKLLERAKSIQGYLVEKKLSKYNVYSDTAIHIDTDKTVVLVPGQVEDDASIVYGGDKMRNIELLQQAREKKPDAYIVYKPHPDVLAGNRKGNIERQEALKYADCVMEEVSLPSLLELCDEVHTITSLSGFEALLRGKKVYTYGLPFYAGWGLTVDEKVCERRKRVLALEQLVAATYILYPRYIHPVTGKPCEVEVVIAELEKLKQRYNSDKIYRVAVDTRNWISRKVQLLIKIARGE